MRTMGKERKKERREGRKKGKKEIVKIRLLRSTKSLILFMDIPGLKYFN